jgi:hypothetical protein
MIDTTLINGIFIKICNKYLSTQMGLRLKNKQVVSVSNMCLHKNTCFDNTILNIISGSKSFSVKKSTLLDDSFFGTYKAFEKEFLGLKAIADDKVHEIFKAYLVDIKACNIEIGEINIGYYNAMCNGILGCKEGLFFNHFSSFYEIEWQALFPIFGKCTLAYIQDMRNIEVHNLYGAIFKVESFKQKISSLTLLDNAAVIDTCNVQLYSNSHTIVVNASEFFDYHTNPFFGEYRAALEKSDTIMRKYFLAYNFKKDKIELIKSIYKNNEKLICIDFETKVTELIYTKFISLLG